MKRRKATFTELIASNKEELLRDKELLMKIEEQLDAKHMISINEVGKITKNNC